jgi:hypothetical protein
MKNKFGILSLAFSLVPWLIFLLDWAFSINAMSILKGPSFYIIFLGAPLLGIILSIIGLFRKEENKNLFAFALTASLGFFILMFSSIMAMPKYFSTHY